MLQAVLCSNLKYLVQYPMEELQSTGNEKLIGAAELADKLDITLQMLSVYVKAYTKVSKTQIKKVGRKGRHFNPLQVEILTNAREMVRSNTGVSVDTAVRRALVFDSEVLESAAEGIETRRGDAVLLKALRAEVAAPIVEELQALRRDIAELKEAQMVKVQEKPVEEQIIEKPVQEELSTIEADAKNDKPGTFTNIGTFLDRFLARFRGS